MILHQIKRKSNTIVITLLYPYKFLGIFQRYRIASYVFINPKSEKFRWLSYPDHAPVDLDDYTLEYLDTLMYAFGRNMIDTENGIGQKVLLLK